MLRVSKGTKVLCGAMMAVAAGTTLNAAQKPATDQGQVAASQAVGFDVYMPIQNRAALNILLEELQTPSSPNYHKWLTPAQFHARFSVGSATLAAAQKQLLNMGLTATVTSPRVLHVTGPANAVQQALGTRLHQATMATGQRKIVSSAATTLPSTLSSLGAVIAGFSGTVHMRTHAHRVGKDNRYSTAGAYWFDDLKQAYDFPSYQAYNGKGVTIGILMTGSYQKSDMDLYFAHEKLATPNFSEVKVLGGAPFDVNNSTETHLDMQQSSGMAPASKVVLYNLPDLSDDSILTGLSQIVESNKADVVSMSFGGPEIGYQAAYNNGVDSTYILREEDDLMAQGNAQGITFVASSGDAGALPVPLPACFTNPDPTTPCGSFQVSAEFPASSPHVTGVGGTNLATTYTPSNLDSRYLYEQANADPLASDIFYGTAATGGYWGSGGGDSVLFTQPTYQRFVITGNNKVRTVPDLSLHMGGCPGGSSSCSPDDSADIVVIGGQSVGVIGTSASAPDFAGLTALNIQRYGTRLGNENYYIYLLAAAQNAGFPDYQVFHKGIPGYNGLYTSGPGANYDRVLGNGTLSGRQFMLMPRVPAAGTPQTPSNP